MNPLRPNFFVLAMASVRVLPPFDFVSAAGEATGAAMGAEAEAVTGAVAEAGL